MASENTIQNLVHNLEQGSLASIIRRILFVVVVLTIATIYIIFKFRGLEHGTAMDQAQIAREIARGKGFITQTIRPLAIAQLESNNKSVSAVAFPDTYHAPIYPYLLAPALTFVKEGWNPEKQGQEIIYAGDRIIAIMGILFFLLAMTINYFTARRLFDHKLAVIGVALVLVSDIFWKYSTSGLPQTLLLFIFSGIVFLLVRAIAAQSEGRPYGLLLGLIGFLFGLLILTHGLTIWILLGAVVFIGFAFKPRGIAGVAVLAIALLVYSPWVVRNVQVTGTPFGVAIFSQFDEVRQSEAGWMRQNDASLKGVGITWFRGKVTKEIISQSGQLFALLGYSVAAPIFFLALLHRFKRKETADLRWAILSMWLFAFVGMAFAGQSSEAIAPNQLHLLFVPTFVCYGMAFLLILWGRMEVNFPYARPAFITVVFLATSVQLILALLPRGNASRLAWPPYAPPIIAVLGKWMQPNEIIASDMPYAVAWYADRKSLWLPKTVEDFNTLNDYNQLQMPISGVYLTPVTSHLGVFPDIATGEYKSWAGLILRNAASLDRFPLKAFVPLPINGESIFYSDRDRWSN